MSKRPPTISIHEQSNRWQDWSDSRIHDPHHEAYDPKRSRVTLPLANYVANLLPGLGLPRFAVEGTQHTYAAWPVWKDSTTKKVKFAPLPKKQAVKLFQGFR